MLQFVFVLVPVNICSLFSLVVHSRPVAMGPTKKARRRTKVSRPVVDKHVCRHCGFKTFMIVHMHEQTCESNPNRSAYIAKRYGPSHYFGGSSLNKTVKTAKTSKSVTLTKIVSYVSSESLPLLSQSDLDTVLSSQSCSLTMFTQSDLDKILDCELKSIFTQGLDGLPSPLPELTYSDVITQLSLI